MHGSGSEEGGYLYDVIDGEQGDDTALPSEPDPRDLAGPSGARPRRWQPVLEVVRHRLLTPSRSALARPGHPTTSPYHGDLRRAMRPIIRARSGPG